MIQTYIAVADKPLLYGKFVDYDFLCKYADSITSPLRLIAFPANGCFSDSDSSRIQVYPHSKISFIILDRFPDSSSQSSLEID